VKEDTKGIFSMKGSVSGLRTGRGARIISEPIRPIFFSKSWASGKTFF
jgi:hypothetical protein